MKRRTFFKGTAVGAAAAAAPAIWSEAKAQARNETLLIVGESPPNSMDIHGVGANRPAYEVSWNTHDRLMTYGVKKDANGNDHYDYTKLEPELADRMGPQAQLGDLQAAQGRQVPRRHADHRQGREVVVRPRRHGGRLPDLPDEGGLAGEARAVRGGRRPHLPRRLPPRRQAHHARHRRAGAGDHELRARARRTRPRPTRGRWNGARTTTPRAAPTRSSAGSRGRRSSTRATTTGRTGRCPRSGASSCASSRRPATGAPCSSAATPTSRSTCRRRTSPSCKSSPKLTVIGTPIENAMMYLGMNVNQKPFDNVKVRQAVAYAVPYQQIMDSVLFGQAHAAVRRRRQQVQGRLLAAEGRLQDRHRQGQGADGRGGLSARASRRRCRSTWVSPAPTSRSPFWCRRAWRRSASRPRSTRSPAPTGAASC